jgi:hypothetical protein
MTMSKSDWFDSHVIVIGSDKKAEETIKAALKARMVSRKPTKDAIKEVKEK